MARRGRKPANVKVVSIQSNLRSYAYRAIISRATNRLLYIHAGCKNWPTFRAAYAHYIKRDGLNGDKSIRWSDAWVESGANASIFATPETRRGERDNAFAHRYEARRILNRLERKVSATIKRMRRK